MLPSSARIHRPLLHTSVEEGNLGNLEIFENLPQSTITDQDISFGMEELMDIQLSPEQLKEIDDICKDLYNYEESDVNTPVQVDMFEHNFIEAEEPISTHSDNTDISNENTSEVPSAVGLHYFQSTDIENMINEIPVHDDINWNEMHLNMVHQSTPNIIAQALNECGLPASEVPVDAFIFSDDLMEFDSEDKTQPSQSVSDDIHVIYQHPLNDGQSLSGNIVKTESPDCIKSCSVFDSANDVNFNCHKNDLLTINKKDISDIVSQESINPFQNEIAAAKPQIKIVLPPKNGKPSIIKLNKIIIKKQHGTPDGETLNIPRPSTSGISGVSSDESENENMCRRPKQSLKNMSDAEKYRHIRRQNNDASKKSRAKRKEKEGEQMKELEMLMMENERMILELEILNERKEKFRQLYKKYGKKIP